MFRLFFLFCHKSFLGFSPLQKLPNCPQPSYDIGLLALEGGLSADDSEQCGLSSSNAMPLIDHSSARDQITTPAVGRSMAGRQTWKISKQPPQMHCRLLNCIN